MVLLTRNGGDEFARCLDALRATEGADDVEWVVVDTASTDGTAERGRSLPGVRFVRIDQAEFGHGRTRNLAAAVATRPVLVWLVQDAEPVGRRFLQDLIEPLGNPLVAGAYARQVPRANTNPVEALFLAATYPPDAMTREPTGGGRVRLSEVFFSNVASATRRSVWEDHRFDEETLMAEDQLWAREVLAAGWRLVYQPSCEVMHSHRYGMGRLLARSFDSVLSLRGSFDDTARDLLQREFAFLRLAGRTLARERRWGWVLYLVVWEAVRMLGAGLAALSPWLPKSLCRQVSEYPWRW